MTTEGTARLAVQLTITARVLAGVLARVLARVLAVHLAITARVVLAITAGVVTTPGTTELLVIRIVKGDRGVNTAGPGCVGIATGERGLFRWGLN